MLPLLPGGGWTGGLVQAPSTSESTVTISIRDMDDSRDAGLQGLTLSDYSPQQQHHDPAADQTGTAEQRLLASLHCVSFPAIP